MKRAPHSLEHLNIEGNRICCSGPEAVLTVTRLFSGAYEVRYDFGAYPVAPAVEEAAALLPDPSFEAEDFSFAPPELRGSCLVTEVDDCSLMIDRESGTVRVERGGVTVHGGPIGTRDTVLPRYPLRVHGAVPRHVAGTFNFPMAPEDRFYGLGDKGGSPNRRNRRFLMHNRDALGYRGDFADPLYKSIPFIIKRNPAADTWLGLAITAPDVVQADFGVESQYYYSFTLRNGPYRYVVFTGDGYGEILEKYTRFTGRPAFPPAFTFGFLGSSMDYVEPDDATDRVRAYMDVVEKHRIPCEGLYLSSGYYKQDNGNRHTFIWNRRKFPDPGAFIRNLRDRGFHVACNVKPGILIDHPEYESLSRSGALVTDGEASVYREYYWGNNAAFWDFSFPTARELWRERLRTRLIEYGVDGIWNDNNEYEIEDSSVPAYSCRSTFALRMAAASWDELRQQAPERRPWVISRSGGMGIQRYARTWSGDNASTWESMRTNLWMGASMGLSALPFFGHDIGGFFGERPEPEQFLRWCQSAVFQPRFVVHSWNDDGKPTELWSYPELLPALRSLVLQHYEFMPYTYSHAYLAHTTGRPIHRLLSLEFPDDPELRDDEIAYLYGDAILVLPIVQSLPAGPAPHGGTVRLPAELEAFRQTVRLPAGIAWYDPENLRLVNGGQEFHFKVRPDRARYLLRTGSLVFHAPGAVSAETGWFPDPVLDIYPPATGLSRLAGGSYDTTLFEDDGSSRLDLKRYRIISVSLDEQDEPGSFSLHLARTDENDWAPPEGDRTLLLRLPPGFTFEDGSVENSLSFGRDFSGARFTIRGGYTAVAES